jgi:DNA-binding winged helix-turn-helix (wHTH) protein
VHVEPQVFDFLTYLIANRGRLVTREELLAQVWGYTYVSDATLSTPSWPLAGPSATPGARSR